MRYFIIAFLLLFLAGICGALEEDYIIADEGFICAPEVMVGIQVADRLALLKYLKEFKVFENQTLLTIIVDNYEKVYQSEQDLPYGDVYLGKSGWIIRYENNHGYMPVWMEK